LRANIADSGRTIFRKLKYIVGGAWDCRFGPNRKKRFPIIYHCGDLRELPILQERDFGNEENNGPDLVPFSFQSGNECLFSG
jgi:hypothetical protein